MPKDAPDARRYSSGINPRAFELVLEREASDSASLWALDLQTRCGIRVPLGRSFPQTMSLRSPPFTSFKP